MQMLSRDSTRPENNKKFLKKKGNTFCCELLNRTGLGQCVMQASTKLCLAFFEFFYSCRKWTAFSTRPSPLKQLYPILTPAILNIWKKAKHRSDILKGLNIMQPVK